MVALLQRQHEAYEEKKHVKEVLNQHRKIPTQPIVIICINNIITITNHIIQVARRLFLVRINFLDREVSLPMPHRIVSISRQHFR